MTGFEIFSIIFFILTGGLDIYTTKRAIFDKYRGVRLPVKEANPIMTRLWKLAGVDVKVVDDQQRTLGIIMMFLLKGLIFGIFLYVGLNYYDGATFMLIGLVSTSVLQLAAALNNIKIIKRARERVDIRLGFKR